MTASVGPSIEIARNQVTFRRLLDAMAQPGMLVRLGHDGAEALASSLHCVLDLEVSVSVVGVAPAFGVWDAACYAAELRRRLDSPLDPPDRAEFVVVADLAQLPDILTVVRRGTLLAPEASATVIAAVPRLLVASGPPHDGLAAATKVQADEKTQKGPNGWYWLEGPGTRPDRLLRLGGLTTAAIECREEANRAYPMGVDMLLIDPLGQALGLPRRVRISTVERNG
ncbi:MAG: phosphonate C-P lyase system protein PhnH [Chloroflexi bacterium]|nr:phosphonate C-P lyase system protein PhnH [Chloroflexota bacterium]